MYDLACWKRDAESCFDGAFLSVKDPVIKHQTITTLCNINVNLVAEKDGWQKKLSAGGYGIREGKKTTTLVNRREERERERRGRKAQMKILSNQLDQADPCSLGDLSS